MHVRKLPPFIIIFLIVILGGGYFLLPSLTVVTDEVYAQSSLAQAKEGMERALLGKGIRVRVVVWEHLPETREEAVILLDKVKSRWVLLSPAVTTVLGNYRIRKEEVRGNVYIGMGRDADLTSVTLVADDEEGYPALEGEDVLLVYQDEKPSFVSEYRQNEALQEVTDTYAKSRIAVWKEKGYHTIVAYNVKNLPSFFSIQETFDWVVPSLYALSLPPSRIKGLVVDDLGQSLAGVLKDLKVSETSVPIPLKRIYVPGLRMRGGLLSSELRVLERRFF